MFERRYLLQNMILDIHWSKFQRYQQQDSWPCPLAALGGKTPYIPTSRSYQWMPRSGEWTMNSGALGEHRWEEPQGGDYLRLYSCLTRHHEVSIEIFVGGCKVGQEKMCQTLRYTNWVDTVGVLRRGYTNSPLCTPNNKRFTLLGVQKWQKPRNAPG